MRVGLSIPLILLSLAGCATPPPPKLWVRTDGQQARGNIALEQEFELAKKICAGEAGKATMSAGSNYHRSVLSYGLEEQKRSVATSAVVDGCMAEKGYVLTDADNAASLSETYAQANKSRAAAAKKPKG